MAALCAVWLANELCIAAAKVALLVIPWNFCLHSTTLIHHIFAILLDIYFFIIISCGKQLSNFECPLIQLFIHPFITFAKMVGKLIVVSQLVVG